MHKQQRKIPGYNVSVRVIVKTKPTITFIAPVIGFLIATIKQILPLWFLGLKEGWHKRYLVYLSICLEDVLWENGRDPNTKNNIDATNVAGPEKHDVAVYHMKHRKIYLA